MLRVVVLLASLVLAALVLVAQAGAAPPVGDSAGRVGSESRERTYLLHVPPAVEEGWPLPLVVALHGGGGTGARLAWRIGLSELADREGFVAVYPDGIRGRWNDGRLGRERPDDVAFVRAVARRVREQVRVDPTRVYVLGRSNGGAMAQRLGCELAGSLAAIASVSGPMPSPIAPGCRRGLPLGVLLLHGTADPIVPWGGGIVRTELGGEVLSPRATAGLWSRRAGCRRLVEALLPDRDPADGTRVREQTALGCRGGVAVTLYAIEGGGHGWPGGLGPHAGPLSRDLDATEAIWDFFERHARAG